MMKNEFQNIRDMLEKRAEEFPEKIFAYWKEQKITYKEFNDNASRIAGYMQELVKKGDKVGIYCLNKIEYIYVTFGLGKIGVVSSHINTFARGDIIAYYINKTHCKYVFVDASLLDSYMEVRKKVNVSGEIYLADKSVIESIPTMDRHVICFDDLMTMKPEYSKIDILKGDPFSIMFTSGTTGMPKAVVQSNYYWISFAEHWVREFRYTPDDNVMVMMPLFHVNPWAGIFSALLAGASFTLLERFSASTIWEDAVKYGVTSIVGHAAHVYYLPRRPESEFRPEHKVRSAWIAPVNHEIARIFRERFKIKDVITGYGSTEAGVLTTFMFVPSGVKPPKGGVFGGYVRDDIECKVVNERDEELPPLEVGEIVLRPKKPYTIFTEYYGDPERTLNAFRNLWFHTGDLGYFDENGVLYFVGRKAECIRVRGEFIPVEYIEEAIKSYEKVEDAIVVGVPSGLGPFDEDVKAYIVPKKGVEVKPEEILDYLKTRLSRTYLPRYIEFVDEIERQPPVGKVPRYKYKERGVGKAWDRVKAGYKV